MRSRLVAQHVANFDVIADGSWHTYTVILSGSFEYNGVIVQLRLDPVLSGQSGAWCNVSRIALTAPPAERV